ncbi:MAG: hypothetical protein HY208_03190 [Nitrospirae bacterium]|nr:hypothetical protein [Nitrospirota bacterium]
MPKKPPSLEPKVIEWDGHHLPRQLQELPPGRYAVELIDPPPLTPQEEEGILAALRQLDAGQGVPLVDVVREIRHTPYGE